MGSVSLKIGDGTARFKPTSFCSSAVHILMLFSVITTNLFALYAFTYTPKPSSHHFHILNHHHTHKNISLISEQVSLILREIDASQKKLAQMEKELLGYDSIDLSTPNIPNELKLFLQRNQLPLGKDSRTGITEMVSSVVSLKIGDGTARFKPTSFCSSAVHILMLFSVITTNLFALYAFTYTPKPSSHHFHILNHHHTHKNISLISEQVSLILREIDASQKKLAQMEKELLGYDSIDLSTPSIPNELKLFLQRNQLPLGKDSRTGITEMVSSVGHSCYKALDVMSQYMSYKPNGACPDDWSVAQKLVLKGCEPLPRRRCFAKTISKVGLLSLPNSLWSNVSEKSYSWSGIGCKDLICLNSKKLNKDCAGCFDLRKSGNEYARFVKSKDAPFNEFIAARGLFPLYLSLDHRFPFYDNVFDIIHVGNGLDVGGRYEKLEFLMFDIDRVIRAGGLFWLDNFLCSNEEKRKNLTRLIERFGYKKLKWVVGEKINGSGNSEVYLSAVLQKPIRA
ncbi:S-adenosyl-L-methionine-dependent methyltransferases superfamily protein [Artemisia annua]|uniref:S-adenosyl-L-methionine-dependent methyltransferases superfamily protein n=1 Tax=Artemisia annua TaxID=35608 RepID=A0A2U1LT66_ARTAN|nr:S-adenosyl-L-methionine-dependent methyltransferases superfamily protein [Artemisia annua]